MCESQRGAKIDDDYKYSAVRAYLDYVSSLFLESVLLHCEISADGKRGAIWPSKFFVLHFGFEEWW